MDKKETRDLFISIMVISIVFSLSNFSLESIIYSLFVIGIAFVCHEMAHRETAKKFGAYAKYVMWPTGILIALLLGIVSNGRIIFAAPGAVYISAIKSARWKTEYTNLKNEEYGIISVAGPLANLGLSLIFIFLNAIYPLTLFSMAIRINIFLAFFNMLPIPPFDGYKVMRWDRETWVAVFLVSIIGLVGTWFL